MRILPSSRMLLSNYMKIRILTVPQEENTKVLPFHQTYYQNYEARQQVKGGIVGGKFAGKGAR